ncbi:hypothetical protein [Solilutibacter silvestris]
MSKKRYLQQLGHSWHIRIKVPVGLRDKVGSTHIDALSIPVTLMKPIA